MKKGKTAAALGGLAVGAGLGILFAPKKGSETRKDLAKKFNDLLESAKKLNKEDAVLYIQNTIEELKDDIESLDKEEILEAAKKKAKELQKKVDSLVKYTKKKGSEELEKAADALREKALEVSKSVVKKLEEK